MRLWCGKLPKLIQYMYINIDIKWKENIKKKNYFEIHATFCKVVMIYGHTEKLLTSYNCNTITNNVI